VAELVEALHHKKGDPVPKGVSLQNKQLKVGNSFLTATEVLFLPVLKELVT